MRMKASLMSLFAAGSLILVCCVLLLSFSQQATNQAKNSVNNWFNIGQNLELKLANFQQQAQNYKLNAPRDFESYNRDVAVFYQQFSLQLNEINQYIQRMDDEQQALLQNWILPFLLFQENFIEETIGVHNQWSQYWNGFRNTLENQIGDKNEPRLEWAVDHINSNKEELNQQLSGLQDRIAASQLKIDSNADLLNFILLASVFTIISLTLIFFGVQIIRPIVETTKVCKAVASGNYGEKVAVKGAGETQQLQTAFNELSSRTQLLINLIADISKPGTLDHKLKTIYESSKDPLSCSWIGLMALDDQKADLHSSVPEALNKNFKHKHVSLNKALGRDLLRSTEEGWLELADLRQLSLKRHDERFLRELHKNTMAHHIVGYPFKCHHDGQFILLFSCNIEEGFNEQQIDLIKALAKIMADGIVSGIKFQEQQGLAA